MKSRYASDCDRGFLVKEGRLEAFDFLVICFLNIGKFFGKNDGTKDQRKTEFYALPRAFIREHRDTSSSWQKVKLRSLTAKIEPFKNELRFKLTAQSLGILRPKKLRLVATCDDEGE